MFQMNSWSTFRSLVWPPQKKKVANSFKYPDEISIGDLMILKLEWSTWLWNGSISPLIGLVSLPILVYHGIQLSEEKMTWGRTNCVCFDLFLPRLFFSCLGRRTVLSSWTKHAKWRNSRAGKKKRACQYRLPSLYLSLFFVSKSSLGDSTAIKKHIHQSEDITKWKSIRVWTSGWMYQ
jgi:hypothetical protein